MNERPRWTWLAIAGALYFAQGFPYGLVNELFPLYLRQSGVSLAEIGLLSTVGLAWTWKVLWSPLVDRYGSYRGWMIGVLVVIANALLALSFVPPTRSGIFWSIVAIVAIASATQDIAIDALAIRMTPPSMLGPVNSARVAAYRGSMIVAGGALAALTPWLGWRGVLQLASAVCAVLAVVAFTIREGNEPRQHNPNPLAGFSHWFTRPRAIVFLIFVLIYKLGDAALNPMVKPYWVDRGFTAAEIGTVTTVIGLSFLIAGAIAGGFFLVRFGLMAGLLWLGLLQMLSNCGYALAATFDLPRTALYAATIVENFTAGLGTAAFLAFLMAICDREHAATQYAMLTAIFGLSRSLIGSFSGLAAERFGYAGYFWLTVALGIPGLLLLPLMRDQLRTDERPATADVVMGG
jgi:MFS transporter, PAT family, beta-lactamase induction signal transducer AmpG